jgi:hypothetical protein
MYFFIFGINDKSMENFEIIQHAIEEVEEKKWGVTQQFFEIHEVVYEGDKPKIAHIDEDDPDGVAVVYFPVKDEKFYLAIYVRTIPNIGVKWVDTEAGHRVYFKATSDDLNFDQLASLTTLKPTAGWSKGDKKRYGNSPYSFSCVQFMPNPEPDEFEDKLNKLLDFLEADIEGIRRLVDVACCQIQVATIFHNGNTMLGGFHLDRRQLSRLGALDVEIDFDLYAEGRFFK